MTWKKKNFPQTARLDYILLSNKLAGKLKYCKTVTCPRNISDHNGVEAEITLDKSLSGPGTFRAMPNIERNEIYKRSVKYLIREELINLTNISDLEKEAEHAKNNNLFEISKSETLTVEAKKDAMERQTGTMMTQDSLIRAGLNIDTNMALDYILLQVKRATINFQRQLELLKKTP